MKKVIAKTSGAFELFDLGTKVTLSVSPSLVPWTHFLEARAGRGEVEVLANNLPMSADPAEWLEFLAECKDDLDLAIASFVAAAKGEKVEAPSDYDRADLEAQANELGIKFKSNISDEKLAERIAAKLEE